MVLDQYFLDDWVASDLLTYFFQTSSKRFYTEKLDPSIVPLEGLSSFDCLVLKEQMYM